MAADAQKPFDFKGIYSLTLAGMEFGRMGLEANEDADDYKAACDITTTGIIRVFVKHSSHSTVHGNSSGIIYETNYRTRNKAKYVKIEQKDGTFKETLVPPDNPAKRPPVPPEMKEGAYDPLTFVLAMRRELGRILRDGRLNYSQLFFDGRRLTRLDFHLEGRRTITYEHEKTPVITLSVKRSFLAGFTASELEDVDPSKPEPLLYIHYSDDERRIPLKLEVRMAFGTVAATLIKQCTNEESCLLGITG